MSSLPAELAGLGPKLAGCITSAAGAAASNPTGISSAVTPCITSAFGGVPLPFGINKCISSILSAVNSSLGGGAPTTIKFNFSNCIPAGLPGLGSGTQEGSGSDGHNGTGSSTGTGTGTSTGTGLGGLPGTGSGPGLGAVSSLPGELAGLGSSVAGCVTSVATGAGSDPTAIASQVANCLTSALGGFQLPFGLNSCISSILGTVNGALAGHVTMPDIAACIPAGLPGLGSGSLPGLGSGSLPGLGSGGLGSVLSSFGF